MDLDIEADTDNSEAGNRAHLSGILQRQISDARLFIRAATISDIPSLLDLEHSCFDSYLLKERNFRNLIRSKSAVVYVGIIDGEICASSVLLYRKNSGGARIYSLAVHTRWQKNDIGRRMIEFVERCATEDGRRWISLEVDDNNDTARLFYYRAGYSVVRKIEGYYPNGSDALKLRKELLFSGSEAAQRTAWEKGE